MKKVLVIVFYWPPSGGSGVQRWLKFVKYLREFGWEPVVFTPLNPAVGETDTSMESEVPENLQVIRYPIFDLNKFAGSGNSSSASKPGIKSRIFSFVRTNLLIPDPRILWKNPSVKFLINWLKENPVQAIVTSGPPQSMHLIGLDLHLKTGIPWLADFRDPWLQFLEFHGFASGSYSENRHRKLFYSVLKNATAISVAHPGMVEEFSSITSSPVHALTNGFDPSDFSFHSTTENSITEKPVRLLFSGILYNKLHVESFWLELANHLKELNISPSGFEIHWVGKIQSDTINALQKYNLQPFCKFHGYVSHQKATELLLTADALLIFLPSTDNYNYLIPGKLFEYLGSGKPIWCIARNNNYTSGIVRETNTGFVLDPQDPEFKSNILQALKNTLERIPIRQKDISIYQRKNLTKKLSDILSGML